MKQAANASATERAAIARGFLADVVVATVVVVVADLREEVEAEEEKVEVLATE